MPVPEHTLYHVCSVYYAHYTIQSVLCVYYYCVHTHCCSVLPSPHPPHLPSLTHSLTHLFILVRVGSVRMAHCHYYYFYYYYYYYCYYYYYYYYYYYIFTICQLIHNGVCKLVLIGYDMIPCDFLTTTCCNWLYRSVNYYLEEIINAAANSI